MNINGFKVIDEVSDEGVPRIKVKDIGDLSPGGFDIDATFDSGQAFRWYKTGDSKYSGIAYGRAVSMESISRKHIVIDNATPEDFENIWFDYLDLDTDYNIAAKQIPRDSFLNKAYDFAGGARILHQEFHETLISFIISALNNIPKIKKSIDNLCQKHGVLIPAYKSASGDIFGGYAFPTADKLAFDLCVSPKHFSGCASSNLCGMQFAGYRCPYIVKTARLLADERFTLDIPKLRNMDLRSAVKELTLFPGVGPKVSECVLLYSGIRGDVCPVDTWVEKTIKKIYLQGKGSTSDVRKFVGEYFGEYAGYVQLCFFHYARHGGLN